jgi:tol-pal system protein YbgF
MKRPFRAALFAMTLLALSGCAAITGPAPAEQVSSADFDQLLQKQDDLHRKIEQLQDNLLLLEAQVFDHRQLFDQMRALLEAQKVTSSGEKTGISQPPPAIPSPEASGRSVLSPTETYLQAFSDYASGRYPQAVLGFESFLRNFPENDYAANAQYWLGECFLAQQQYPRAIEEFQRMVSRYPQGAKTPDALLKLAHAFKEMNQPDRATATLQALRQRYPNSAAARHAEQER